MKNYILFSTNDSRAIDNVSFVIETSMDRNDAIKMIAGVCKYSSFTASPIGAPLSCTVFDMEHALEIIKSIRLHMRQRVVDKKEIDIVISKDGIPGVHIFEENGAVCLDLQTQYEPGNPALLIREHDKIGQIIELFGYKHVAYRNQRSKLMLVRSDAEDIGIDWALVKGDVVQITKKYSYIEVEI